MGELRRLWAPGLIAVVLAVFGGCVVVGPASAAGDANEGGCPASTVSSPGFRPWLPDCRAYEIVSEANSDDLSTMVGSYGFPDGAHVLYKEFLPLMTNGTRNGLVESFLATRTSSGWVRQAISPPQGEGPTNVLIREQTVTEPLELTGGFSQAFVNSPYQNPFEEPRLDQTTGVGVYKLSFADGAVETVSLPDSGVLTQAMIESTECLEKIACGAFLVGASVDGSKAFFETTAKLTTALGTTEDTHTSGNEIYERTGDDTYLVGVLPDGSVPACGVEVSQGMSNSFHVNSYYAYGAVAPGGANLVFSDCAGGLYLRDLVDETTVQLQGSWFGGRAGTGAGEEEEIFTLGDGRIFEYHVESGQTSEVGEGSLLAYSSDGSRVYALRGEGGIYVYHEGIGKLISGTPGGYGPGPFGEVAGGRIASGELTEYVDTANMPVASAGKSNGTHFLFIDTSQLTGYENEEHQEAYVYDAETEKVTCISCNPTHVVEKAGEEPHLGPEATGRVQLITRVILNEKEGQFQSPSPPFISEDGSRAVFETTEALVPQDTNGTADVYEWEREGSEGCSGERLHVKGLIESTAYNTVDEGCLYLLSSGLGKEIPNTEHVTSGAHLVGASSNLKDVYIETDDSLLPGVDNSAGKLYDVRIDGGFPYTPPAHGCEAIECEMSPGKSTMLERPATEMFEGPGNVKGVASARHGELREVSLRKRLRRALAACRKRDSRDRGKRRACEQQARRRNGAKAGRMAAQRRGGGSK